MTTDSRPTLLVVDDIAANRTLLARIFTPHGFRIIEAQSGSQALSLLNETSVALVLLDMAMPELNGIDVTKEDTPTARSNAAARDYGDRQLGRRRCRGGAGGRRQRLRDQACRFCSGAGKSESAAQAQKGERRSARISASCSRSGSPRERRISFALTTN